MKVFNTLQELLEYVPRCILCQKNIPISIEGYLTSADAKKWYGRKQRVYFKLKIKDGVLRDKCRGQSIAIEASTNKLLEGGDFVNRLMLQPITVKKCCPTCAFKFIASYQDGNVKTTNTFPPLTLKSEELSFTMKGKKNISILKHYAFLQEGEEPKCIITYDRGSLEPIDLDFTKFTSLDQVAKKIKTIVTFQ